MNGRSPQGRDTLGAMATPGPVLGRHPAREQNNGGAAVVLGAGALLAAYLYWRDHHGASGNCGPQTGQAASLPTGIYTTCSVPGNANSCTDWWVVQGVGRWGIPSPTQLARCWPGSPTIIDAATVGGFGSADSPDNEYIGTIGYVSACTQCPPGSPGLAAGA